MRPLIHEFLAPRMPPCGSWHEGDGITAVADAVTCPECRQRQAAAGACPSRRRRDGKRCAGHLGHGGLHHAETYGVTHVWTDEDSPTLATDLRHTE